MMQSSYLSKKVVDLKPSGIRRFFDLAAQMKDVISLGVGEPDFVTPWNFIEQSFHALEQGYTSYTENAGMIELRREISAYLSRNYRLSYDPSDQVIVSVGASQAIDLALRAVIDPGDEVIVVEPSFVAYMPTVTLAGGTPVMIQTKAEDEFKLKPEQIEAAITPNTKAIILCNPNNPTGTFLSQEELEQLATVIEKHDLLVLSDEIYAELTYDDDYTSFPYITGMKERTILISGFSKAFAMTGWRLGYAAGPAPLISAMVKIHQYTMMCAPTMAQHAALEALKNGRQSVNDMIESYKQRRNFIVSSLNEIRLECPNPGGAFYAFPSIEATGLTSTEFAEQLLQEEQVAVVPGNVFGANGEGYIRCSYATSIKQLDEAMKRMKRFVEKRI
ncbi:aminotransferase [Pseudalkalibacillus sp. A8]|uniref:aminotransferase n=1 Tax=Pseudalkalibacillus sp. A8 TaxID=3382641 RepID=UPI0038B4536F